MMISVSKLLVIDSVVRVFKTFLIIYIIKMNYYQYIEIYSYTEYVEISLLPIRILLQE